jgi:hypothetical protein
MTSDASAAFSKREDLMSQAFRSVGLARSFKTPLVLGAMVTLVILGLGSGFAAASTAQAGQLPNPTEAPLPGNQGANPGVVLNGVACPSAGACTAAGLYDDTAGNQPGLFETLGGNGWASLEAPVPHNANTSPISVAPLDIACPSPTSCLAVGSYHAHNGQQRGLIETLSKRGAWKATAAPMPQNAGPQRTAQLDSVACPEVDSCVAVGMYNITNGSQVGGLDPVRRTGCLC